MKRRARGSSGGGQFAPDLAGRTPPSTGHPRRTGDPATSAHPASPDLDDLYRGYSARGTSPGRRRCLRCGEFTSPTGGHACAPAGPPAPKPVAKIAPALTALGTFGVAAGALAAGPIGMAAAAGVLVSGWLLVTLARRTATRKLADRLPDVAAAQRQDLSASDTVWLDQVQSDTDALARKMGVPGAVTVLVNWNQAASPAAGRLDPDRSVIYVTPMLRSMTRDQVRGILAHETAHLQPQSESRWKRVLSRAALPAGLAVGAATGLAVVPAAGVATVVWFGGKLVSAAASRSEERRADREAYQQCGEKFTDALTEVHERMGYHRTDLPWRAEDVAYGHPSLENRLAHVRG